MIRHSAPALAFAALAIIWTYPLVTNLAGQIPGPGLGDNVQFLWMFWWMRTALDSGLSFFHTAFIFVPAGADLTLHSHTALPAFVGATVLRWLPPAAAMNLTILASLFLNGLCAYALAWRVTRDRAAALVGGLVFSGSSYISAHLNGHFNLTAAWTLPLFALAAFEAMHGRRIWAALAGVVLAVTIYIDYYYVIFELALVLAIAVLVSRRWSVTLRGAGSSTRMRIAQAVGALVVLDLALIGAILASGGFAAQVGGFEISARSLYNPLQIFWLLVGLWLWLRFGPKIATTAREPYRRVSAALAIMVGVFLIGAAPIVLNTINLFAQGDYVTQKYFWRSAPAGIDAGTLVLGPPYHGLWGEHVRAAYDVLAIDTIEGSGWLGIVPMLLAIVALRGYRSNDAVRHWALIGLVFFVWALGPHLRVFGRNTGMILPEALLRFIPIVNNARIPGRAMVIVTLALAVLAAIGATRWRPAFARRSVVLAGVCVLLIAESLAAPFPVAPLVSNGIYVTLRDRPETGAVCELPLSLHDGFGARGTPDDVVLLYQTIHLRPIVGGFVGRMPPSIVRRYEADPLLGGLLRLSEPGALTEAPALPDGRVAADRLKANGVAFVVLNRLTASARLTEYVHTMLPLQLIEAEGGRELYVVR